MARSIPTTSKTPRFVLLASVCVVVAALYFAQGVLIPLALATLLTFLLSPLVQRLERWRLHRVPSVIVVVVLAFGVLGVLGWVVVDQVMSLARDLPAYKDNIKAKLHWLPRPGEPHLHPVIAEVRRPRHQELLRLRRHQGLPFLLREREPHDRLVSGERQVDDPADPELHPVTDDGLVGARQ